MNKVNHFKSIAKQEGGPSIGTFARPCTASREYVIVRAFLDDYNKPLYDARQHSEHDWRFISENMTRREWEAEQGIKPADVVDRSR